MNTMPITDFKAHALRVLDKVSTSKESVVVTKRGKPLAEVIPFEHPDAKQCSGKLAEAKVYEGNMISPVNEELSAEK